MDPLRSTEPLEVLGSYPQVMELSMTSLLLNSEKYFLLFLIRYLLKLNSIKVKRDLSLSECSTRPGLQMFPEIYIGASIHPFGPYSFFCS